jgi:hypothetical protein
MLGSASPIGCTNTLVRHEAYDLQWVRVPPAELTVHAVMKKTI